MFKISFSYLNKDYSAVVQKIQTHPVEYIVFCFMPRISCAPERMVYFSNKEKDQLVYRSFDISNATLIRLIGEKIFIACQEGRIAVHS